jgi:hypothetical protein
VEGKKMPIVHNTDEEYHGGEGVSKSTLWKSYDQTPFHAKYEKREEKPHFAVGKAAHIAILEPETLDARVTKGPAGRRGNKWKEALDFAEHFNTILLTEGDYDQVMLIRDLAATVPEVRLMQDGEGMSEVSAYHVDEETGILVKTRPDRYNSKHKIIGDIKNMAKADFSSFQRDVGKFGYHVQEAMYSDVWEKGAGLEVEAFFFVAFEKTEPPLVACYELDAEAVAEGHAIYRKALKEWAECERSGEWPGYPAGIQSVSLRRWDYRETTPPTDQEIQ